MKTIAVTGATGSAGTEIVKALAAHHENVLALVRNPEKAAKLKVQTKSFDFNKPETFAGALTGVGKLVLIAPSYCAHLPAFLKHAKNLEQIIIISGLSANTRISPLAAIEEEAYRTNIPYTTLRLNWFMQNFTTFLLDDINSRGVIELPAGSSHTSFIDTRDIGAIVNALLASKEHLNKVYPVTGNEALTHGEVAHLLSTVANKTVTYHALAEDAAKQKWLAEGWDDASVTELILLFREMREGVTEPVSPVVETILGRPPITFEKFAHDYMAFWQ